MTSALNNALQTSDRMGITLNGHRGRSRRYYQVLELWLTGLSYAEIGRRLGFSRQCAQEVMRPLAAMKHRVMWDAFLCCEHCKCGLGKHGHYHHKTRTYPPNRRDNLQYLCISCHKKADWRSK